MVDGWSVSLKLFRLAANFYVARCLGAIPRRISSAAVALHIGEVPTLRQDEFPHWVSITRDVKAGLTRKPSNRSLAPPNRGSFAASGLNYCARRPEVGSIKLSGERRGSACGKNGRRSSSLSLAQSLFSACDIKTRLVESSIPTDNSWREQ